MLPQQPFILPRILTNPVVSQGETIKPQIEQYCRQRTQNLMKRGRGCAAPGNTKTWAWDVLNGRMHAWPAGWSRYSAGGEKQVPMEQSRGVFKGNRRLAGNSGTWTTGLMASLRLPCKVRPYLLKKKGRGVCSFT